MTLNTQHWQSVKSGEFIVGAWPLKIENQLLMPGELVPKEKVIRTLQALFELNRIIPVESKPEPIKATKKRRGK